MLFSFAFTFSLVILQYGTIAVLLEILAPWVGAFAIGIGFTLFDATHIRDTALIKAELAQKEEMLREKQISEERLNLATKTSAVWDWDIKNDKLYISPSFFELLGYSEEEFFSQSKGKTSPMLHKDDRARYKAKLDHVLTTPEAHFINEHRFRTKSGAYRWFIALGRTENFENGKATRFYGHTTDITDRYDLEQRLNQSVKMEAIGNLTGGMAHDFNNLLAVVLGNLELIRLEKDEAEIDHLVNEAIAAVERGSDLTKKMLSFARRAHFDSKNCNLNGLISETMSWVESSLPPNIVVDMKLDPKAHNISTDTNLAQNAFLNLVLNSRDAMEDGGTLTITTRNIKVDTPYEDMFNELILPGDYVEIAFKDTGHGIDPVHLPRIFDPFFTNKAVGKGSGLGLSMVQGFVKQSDGSLEVTSNFAQGTEIRLKFKSAGKAIAPKEPQQKTAKKSNQSPVILLVEDDPSVLAVETKLLNALGFEIISAKNGQEASEMIANGIAFDLLISDISMPGEVQGNHLAQELLQRSPKTPIIFITGHDSRELGMEFTQYPHITCLSKPVNLAALDQAIQKVQSGVLRTNH